MSTMAKTRNGEGRRSSPSPVSMNGRNRVSFIRNKVAIVTGAAKSTDENGAVMDGINIGGAIAEELVFRGAKAVALVDLKEHALHAQIDEIREGLDRKRLPCCALESFVGDVTDETFRKRVFNEMENTHGAVSICVPAAGISRNRLSVKIDTCSGVSTIYPVKEFREVQEVNLVAPVYWALEMASRIGTQRWREGLQKEDGSLLPWDCEREGYRGVVLFLGSVIQWGNVGQLAYAVSKGGENSAGRTLDAEWKKRFGVFVRVLNPGFASTPMVLELGDKILAPIRERSTTGDLIDPRRIADVACQIMETPELDIVLGMSNGWAPLCL